MAAPAAPAPSTNEYAPTADTWDHVVRAVGHTRHLGAAAALMCATREHAHDAELLWLTRAVRGGGMERETLLVRAARRLDVARVGEILAACPTPASRAELLACGDRIDRTALHWVCQPRKERHKERALALVELLLGAGADPLARARCTFIESQPIHLAARWSARLVQRLVQAGASIDGDVAGASTLCEAAVARTALGVRMIPTLVALGARKTLGRTVMYDFAACPVKGVPPSDGDVAAAIKALKRVGCSLTRPGYRGKSPLDLAADKGNSPVVRALLARGVAATASSLAHAVAHPGVVRQLLAAGAPVEGLTSLRLFDGGSTTPLIEAARTVHLESLQLLLGAGANVNACDEHGRAALMIALRSQSADIAAILGVVEALLAAGANVATRDSDGNTPLHHLAAVPHARPCTWAAAAARLLLDSGADGRIENNAGQTPAQAVPATARGGELHRLLLEAAGA